MTGTLRVMFSRLRLAAPSMPAVLAAALAALALGAGVAACGSDDGGDDDTAGLSAAAREGREVAESNGCMACHRVSGGGIGPQWQGLLGSTRTLEDGSTVTADEEYIVRAIVDPGAEVVEGFNVNMPTRDLSDDEVDSIVAYISELAP